MAPSGQAGQHAERGFGLLDYNARYYDPGLGRFVSADTVGPNPGAPQDLNRYAYAGNNPLRYTDPTGHYLLEEEPDDPFLWRQDKPGDTGTLIRTAEPMVETRQITAADLFKPFAYIYGGAVSITLGADVIPAGGRTGLSYFYYYATQVYLWANNNPFKAGVASGLGETAVECALTGGGCTPTDYIIGGSTAGLANRASTRGALGENLGQQLTLELAKKLGDSLLIVKGIL